MTPEAYLDRTRTIPPSLRQRASGRKFPLHTGPAVYGRPPTLSP
jgi:hypothetical protein